MSSKSFNARIYQYAVIGARSRKSEQREDPDSEGARGKNKSERDVEDYALGPNSVVGGVLR